MSADLLTAANVTWGWFQGGFTRTPDGKCSTSHPLESFDRAVGVDPRTDPLKFQDYVPHHNPFQYFASTANPLHLPPTSVAMVGKTDQATICTTSPGSGRRRERGTCPRCRS